MAGRRRQREILNALDALALETMPVDEGEDAPTAIDYVTEWVSDGRTMSALSQKLGDILGYPVSRALVNRTLKTRDPDVLAKLDEVRYTDTAHALVEEAQDILDDRTNIATRERLQHAKQRADFRTWRAKVLAPNTYGERKTVDVNINLPAAHLAALRKVNAERALGAGEMSRIRGARDTDATHSASVPNDEVVVEAVFEEGS